MTSDSLIRAAAACFAQEPTDHATVATCLFRVVEKPADLHELTREAYSQSTAFGPRAYLHSNGFLKIEFARFGLSQLRLRAHLWNRAWGLDNQNPHDHAFDFSSLVIAGELRHRVFERVAGGEPYHRFMYQREMREGVDAYQLIHKGVEELRLADEKVLSASQWYSFAGRKIHTFDPISATAATFLVSQPDLKNSWSNIYSTRRDLHDHERNARSLLREEVLALVGSVLSA